MISGVVLEKIRLKRTVMNGENVHFLRVGTEESCFVAADPLGCAEGADVLICTGESAARWIADCPVDAVVVGILGKNEN